MLERDPSFAAADGELEGQHRVLADRLVLARESLNGLPAASGGPGWERERNEAAAAARALREIVTTHLDHEEDVAFSRYRRAFTAAEFAALGARAWKLVGARSVVFAGPWVLDHTDPAERAQLLADQPSAWTGARALAAFVAAMPHQGVMAKLRPHMGPTRFTTWTAPGSALPPPWDVAIGHLDSSSSRDHATPPPTHRSTDHQPAHPDKEQPS